MTKSPNTRDARKISKAQLQTARQMLALNDYMPALIKQHARKLLILIALAIAVGLGIYLWQSHKSPATGEAALKAVESKVSKHYVLPDNEVPALATITDTSKLTTPFFKGTKNGDQVLIYQKNHIAIIYRPSIDRVVSVGPVSIDAPPGGKP